MNNVRRAFSLPVLLSISATVAQVPPAQRDAQRDAPPVVLKSTTRLVQVSVVVQNHKGDPVVDLKKEDFQIRDNGRPQKISLFSVDSSTALPQAPAPLPQNVFTNELEQRPGTPSSVTVILLDGLNTNLQDQSYAKAQVIKFLKTLHPGDRVGLYLLGRGIKVLHDYTTDSTDLLAKLEKYTGQNLPDLAASEPSSMDGDSLSLGNWFNGAGGSGQEADFYTINRVNGTLAAIEFIANHLARLPGRKNLVWVSGGFPLDIGFDSIEDFNDPTREHKMFTEEMDRTIRAVNNANLAIYPVDARGLVPDLRFSAENRKVDLSPKLSMGPIVKNQQTMSELASRTGGRAYYNTNDLKSAIRDAISDARVVYTLGYYPEGEQFDNKFHKLDVKVLERSGLNLRYRKGYFDEAQAPQDAKSRRVDLNDAVWSPLDASGMGLIVGAKPNPQDPKNLDVVVKIDQKAISLEPNADKWAGRLDLLFVQKDDRGRQYNSVADTLDLNLSRGSYDKLTKDGLLYKKSVTMSPQARQLRVIVRDAPSGTLGSVTVPFDKLVR